MSDWFLVQDTAKDAIGALIAIRPKTKLVNVPTLTCLQRYVIINFVATTYLGLEQIRFLTKSNTFTPAWILIL